MWLYIGLILFAGSPAFANQLTTLLNAECEVLLSPSSSEMQLSAAEAADVQQLYNSKLGIPMASQSGLLDWLKIDASRHDQIVLFSLNNFFGDSLIFHFSLLDFFLKKHPGKKIKIVSPKAGVLTRFTHPDVEWVQISVRFAEYAKREDRDHHIKLLRERLPSFVKEHVAPGAFVFFDLTTLEKAGMEVDPKGKNPELRPSFEFYRALHEVGATAVGLSNLSDGYIFLGISAIDVIAPSSKMNPDAWAISDSIRLRTTSGKIVGLGLRRAVHLGSQNVYESWLQNLTVLFGSAAYLKWDSQYFVNASEDGPIIGKFMRNAGLDPAKPFILINLNTLGRDKVRELTPIYAETMKSVIRHILQTYPHLNVMAFFPENQFGPEVQEEILDFRSEYPGRLALIPGSMREVQPALVSAARSVVSYDSGLAHLSSFKPKEAVLTVSTAAGVSHLWRRPGQNFVKLGATDAPNELAVKIIDWIDRAEAR
jgi:hypothetical protein